VAIAVARTLEVMANVYGASISGGPESARFRAFVDAAANMIPVHGYNPMTSKPVVRTIETLINMRAEDLLETIANRTARLLDYEQNDTMHFTVATPGMWTDRLATEVEHRLLAKDPGGLLWWFDQKVDPEILEFEIVAQTVRLINQRRTTPTANNAGAPANLAAAARQEGEAGAIAGHRGAIHPAAAEVLDVFGSDTGLSTMVAFLYGDSAAEQMGFTPLGLVDRTGYEHAVALARTDLQLLHTATLIERNKT
jgi:hypothetical protein